MNFHIENPEQYISAYQQSIEDPERFWNEVAKQFIWESPWTKVFESDFITARNSWFIDGRLNITINVLDRHLPQHRDKVAIYWEPNDPVKPNRKITYGALYASVCRFANALLAQGVQKGDRVCLYMPMVPELAIAMLACARIGAIHSVVFAGFSAHSLAERILDAGCSIVICADYNHRGTKFVPVKAVVDEALETEGHSVRKVIVYQNTGGSVSWNTGRDLWWHEITDHQDGQCQPVIMDSEDPLFMLYTSGSTGKPKGVVHSTGGYMVYTAYTFKNVFQHRPEDIFWCTADIGWITGHSYLVYGPLLNGSSIVMFEGIPSYPDASRFWSICEKYKVNIFYTAPTAIRSLMAAGDEFTEGHDLSSLRVIGSVGEPINEEAWHWYHDKIGRGKAHLVDTWWQTETGGIMITPIAGITDARPCFASYPMPGVQPLLVDPAGNEIHGNDVEGLLCIKSSWPSIIRTT